MAPPYTTICNESTAQLPWAALGDGAIPDPILCLIMRIIVTFQLGPLVGDQVEPVSVTSDYVLPSVPCGPSEQDDLRLRNYEDYDDGNELPCVIV